MKKIKIKAWLLDDGIYIEGYTFKGRFYPNDPSCGFSFQKFNKKDINKNIFYNVNTLL